MNTKQLRQKILDLAIKGKLVPQDPNDEPASKLLERIREEKEQLIKEGKLKRDKNESYIFVGDDKLHYEKFADGSVVCIEDEIPFEIPDSWAWERLDNICRLLTDGTHQTPTYTDMGHIFLSSKNVTTNKINWDDVMYIPNELHEKLYNRLAPELNDILLAKNGTIGKAALVDRNIEFDVYVTLAVIRLFKNYISPQYIHKIIESKYIQDFFKGEQKGIGVPNLHLENIRKTLVPLPPQSEQKRISETVEILLELVDSIESDKIDLSNLIKQTKAKILDLAIKGKLVPQDPNDEPADKLIEKIKEEKEKLIKEGKLKRDKNETYIFKNSDDNSYYEQIDGETICIDDDLPFEIPDTWRWCRLKEIINIVNGFTPLRSNPNFWNSNDIPWFTVDDIREQGRFIQKTRQHISNSAISKNSNRIVPENTVLLCCTASVGEYALTKIPLTTNQQFNGLVIKNECKEILNYLYLYEFVKTLKNMLILESGATTFNFLSVSALGEFLIPIPPYKEQLLIAKNLENIFSYLDNLETIIKGS